MEIERIGMKRSVGWRKTKKRRRKEKKFGKEWKCRETQGNFEGRWREDVEGDKCDGKEEMRK